MILSYHGARLADVPKSATSGLYLLQSTAHPSYYRMGESAAINERLGTHRSSAPKNAWKRAPNFAQTFRPWVPIWIATIGDVSKLARVSCEHLLFAAFVSRFPLVDESAFEADPYSFTPLIELAESTLPGCQAAIVAQTRDKFDKKAHWNMSQ